MTLPSTGTRFLQGALSGGGYLQGISISNDGLTRLICYDSSNAWIWNDTTSQWDNVFNQHRVPAAFQTWGGGSAVLMKSISANAVVVAPSNSNRVYAITVTGGGGASAEAMIWRSDDRCENWVDTGYRLPSGTTGIRGLGPRLVVDPNNPNIVYVGDNAGVVHRSFDAGGTWEKPTSLTSLMLTAVTNGTTASNSAVLNFAATPADVITRNGYVVYASNVTRNNSIIYALYVSSTTATTATLVGTVTGTAGVASGDTIAFGSGVCIAFDPSSGTTNGRTNRIYIGWGYGASGVYVSDDAGQTWSATAVGGPAQTRRMHCSSDGVLYVCDYATSAQTNTQNAWRYQSGTWTNLSITGSSGNIFNCIASDPLNAGKVAIIQYAGNIRMSSDYGTTWVGLGNTNTRAATDVPWLATTLENWQSQGMIAFDPVVNNRLWVVEGIGCWYCTPPYANSTITITSQNKNQQGLIVDKILKPPGQSLLVGTQDRSTIKIDDPTIEPTYESGIGAALGAPIIHTWDVDYAKSDPTFIVCINSQNCYVSSSSGAYNTWTRRENKVPGVNNGGCIAAQTPNNIVWFPANNGTPGYSTDSGLTWSSCLFAGSTRSTGWSNSQYNNRHMMVADLVEPNTYYAFSYSNDANGGIWRTTDGGANWTNMAGGLGPFPFVISMDFQMCAIPGKQGHLMIGYGAAYNNGTKLYRSVDAGATWVAVTNTDIACQVAAGKEKPGSSYPAIYMTGTLSGDSEPGIFRADDFTDDTSVMPTWTRLCRAPANNMDSPKSLCADLDTYGKVYIGFGSTGYAWGELVSIYGKF